MLNDAAHLKIFGVDPILIIPANVVNVYLRDKTILASCFDTNGNPLTEHIPGFVISEIENTIESNLPFAISAITDPGTPGQENGNFQTLKVFCFVHCLIFLLSTKV